MDKKQWVVALVGLVIIAVLIVLYRFGLLGNSAIAAALSPVHG